MRLSDLITGPLITAFGGVVIWGAVALPQIPGLRFGPDLIPLLIGGGLVIAGVFILIAALLLPDPTSGRSRAASAKAEAVSPASLFTLPDRIVPTRPMLAAAWTLLGPIFCIVFFDIAGFPIVALVYMVGLMALMNARPLIILTVAPLTVLALHIGFTQGLRLQLPAGWLSGVLP